MSVNFPIVNAPNLYIDNLEVAYATTTTLTMAAGRARNSSNEADIILETGVTINSAVVGINGIDDGTFAANKMYRVFAVGDSTFNNTSGAIISESDTPNLPAGYDMYRLRAYWLTNGSTQFALGAYSGSGKTIDFWYEAGIAELSGGSSATLATVDLASSVPPLATNVFFDVIYTPNGATDVAEFIPYGSAATSGIVRFGTGVAGAQRASQVIPCGLNSGSPAIQYKVTSGDTLTLNTQGFRLYV